MKLLFYASVYFKITLIKIISIDLVGKSIIMSFQKNYRTTFTLQASEKMSVAEIIDNINKEDFLVAGCSKALPQIEKMITPQFQKK